MDRIIETVVDAVLGLRGTVAYAVVGVLAFGEAAAFLGLVTPGEVSMVLGGVLASRGTVSFAVMAGVAGVAAALGDTVGYALGRRFGQRVLSWRPVRQRFSDTIESSQDYFRAGGGRAIVLGRWASVVRTFIPFVAGTSRMPYPRFLAFSAPSAMVWAWSFIAAGYLAGESWHLIQDLSGPASVVLLLLLAIALLLRWAARRVAARQERLAAWWRRVVETRPARWLRRRYGAQLRWLARRFDPTVARGLNLTLGFVALAAGLAAIGFVLTDLRAFSGLALLNTPVRLWFAEVNTAGADRAARVVTGAFSVPWLVAPTAVLVTYAAWRGTARTAARIVAGVAGAVALAWVVQGAVTEPAIGTRFPPTSVTAVAALIVHATAFESTRLQWGSAVRIAAAGAFVTAVVGVAELVTADATLTGVVFGAALGTAWAAAVEVQARLPFRLLPESGSPETLDSAT